MTLALKIYATILIILFINAYFSHALYKNSDSYEKEERREAYYGFSCLILVLWLFFYRNSLYMALVLRRNK